LLFNDKFYKFKNIIMGGWVAIIDKNFILSIAPQINHIHQFCGERFKNNMFGIRFIDTVVLCADPGKIFDVELQLFIGPKISEILKSFVSGLELSIDYGILWPLSQPVFILLQYIYSFIHNWGWSIIIITVFIKLFFLRLSAGSYRSMSKMKKLQPIIDDMKIKYGGDKHNFGIMLMKMYKKEQVNPIVGCLPIIIQIPVFISFYYVILESIELRHSPFVFWIYDLSAKDPYYILPILMGMTMFVQQKISPSPSEYMQKKIMAILPFIFTLFFLNFPSGLVIYWIVNNLLSISQQYYIMNNLK